MANAIPAAGSRISLVSSGDIRYEGILYSIDMVESKIALQQGEHYQRRGSSPDLGQMMLYWVAQPTQGCIICRAEIRATGLVFPACRLPMVRSEFYFVLYRYAVCSEIVWHRGQASWRGAGPSK